MTDKTSSTHLDSDLHTLGMLVAGNLTPDAIPTDQWPAITTLALQHGLAPMLHWTLKQAGVDTESNPAWHPLVHARYQTAIDWALKERAQLEIDAALRTAGIPAIWLKGSVLARTVYPEPSLRPMGDLDVLVSFHQREAALEVVRRQGYDFFAKDGLIPLNSGDPLNLRYAHHYHLRGGISDSVVLELHFQLLGHSGLMPAEHLQWFFSQKQVLRLEDKNTIYTLTQEAHLLYLAAHAILQHGEANMYLLRYFDLHRMITQYSLSWEAILDKAVELKWTYVLERALLNAVEFFTTPVATSVFAILVRQRSPEEDTRRVVRMQSSEYYWEKLLRNLTGMSMADRFQLLWRKMCPPRPYMRWRYNIRRGFPTWPYYLYRWLNRGYHFAKAIWNRNMP